MQDGRSLKGTDGPLCSFEQPRDKGGHPQPLVRYGPERRAECMQGAGQPRRMRLAKPCRLPALSADRQAGTEKL